jgi:lipooligosaccharide transport system permease protein
MDTLLLRITPPVLVRSRRAPRLVERNYFVYRRGWVLLVSGFFEPLFYLLSISVGVGHLVGTVSGPSGHPIRYVVFVAPALMAAAAMNGAIYDSTFNVFHKLKFAKTYEALLATPVGVPDVAVGEIGWALLRGSLYSATFLAVMAMMGLVRSGWAVLALPSAMLVGLGFAALGMAVTCFMRSWQDFDLVLLAILPMFLFSGTFYPLSTYPGALQTVVRLTPLYQGVALLRGLDLGAVGPSLVGHAAYLAAMAAIGLTVSQRRLARLLLR